MHSTTEPKYSLNSPQRRPWGQSKVGDCREVAGLGFSGCNMTPGLVFRGRGCIIFILKKCLLYHVPQLRYSGIPISCTLIVSNLPITRTKSCFPSSVEHCNFTPPPISRTLRFFEPILVSLRGSKNRKTNRNKQKQINEARYGSSFVTFSDKDWGFVYSGRQSFVY